MKHLMSKKVKILAISILGLLLIIGGLTTVSYITTQTQRDHTINITVGYIKLESLDTVWQYTSAGIDENTARGIENLTEELIQLSGKLRPGDTFSKTAKITNTGTLPANIRLSVDIDTGLDVQDSSDNDLFIISVSNIETVPIATINNIDDAIVITDLPSGGEVSFNIDFKINTAYKQTMEADQVFSAEHFSIIIDAVQTNAPF